MIIITKDEQITKEEQNPAERDKSEHLDEISKKRNHRQKS